jgi:uncharacterized membrane protein YfcA
MSAPAEDFAIGDMEWYSWVYIVFTGGGVGFLGGFAGIGGLPIMVAMLRSPPMDICQHEAQGTVLAVMLPPMALLGVLVMREEAKLLWKHAAAAFCSYALTSFLGAKLAYLFDGKVLGILFAVHMICLSIFYANSWRKGRAAVDEGEKQDKIEGEVTNPLDDESPDESPERQSSDASSGTDPAGRQEQDGDGSGDEQVEEEEEEEEGQPLVLVIREGAMLPFTYLSMAVAGAVIGVVGGLFGTSWALISILSGLLLLSGVSNANLSACCANVSLARAGIGAGVFMVPIMTELMGMSKNDARTLSMLILLPPASAGAVVEYSSHDNVDWWLSAILFGLYFVTNPAGAKVRGLRARSRQPSAGASVLRIVLC